MIATEHEERGWVPYFVRKKEKETLDWKVSTIDIVPN